jgi:hypothetical protein
MPLHPNPFQGLFEREEEKTRGNNDQGYGCYRKIGDWKNTRDT